MIGIFVSLSVIRNANLIGANINGMVSIFCVLGSLLNGLLVYCLGMFSIKLFENVAISAKMLTDIKNKILDDSKKEKL